MDICIIRKCLHGHIVLKVDRNVFVCISHQLREQEKCYMEVKHYISDYPTSQSSSGWPSAAPLSSPYLWRKNRIKTVTVIFKVQLVEKG